jgi:hypothetical protein
MALIFNAPLLTSIDPVTSANDTITPPAAATARIVEDHEGILRRVNSGELRFRGTRRAENLITDIFTESPWTQNGDVTDNGDGSQTYVISGGGTDRSYSNHVYTFESNTAYFISFEVVSMLITGSLTNAAASFSGIAPGPIDLPANPINPISGFTGRWGRKITTGTLTDAVGAIRVGLGVSSPGVSGSDTATMTIRDVQVEEISGSGVQCANEYISPVIDYNVGNSVTGVKNFPTLNGNSHNVTTGDITEATGAAIAAATLKGYFAEPTIDNIVNAGAVLDITAYTPVGLTELAAQETGPDGRVSMGTITEDGLSSGHSTALTMSGTHAADATVTASLYFKPNAAMVSAARQIFLNIRWTGGTIAVWYNVTTQAVTLVTGTGTATTDAVGVEVRSDGIIRMWVTGHEGATDTTPNLQILLKDSGGNSTYTGDSSSALALWGMQIEVSSNVSSLYPVGGGTRAADNNLKYHIDNVPLTLGSLECDFCYPFASGLAVTATNRILRAGNDNGRLVFLSTGGQDDPASVSAGGTAATQAGPTIAAGDVDRFRVRWNAADDVEGHNISVSDGITVGDDPSPVADFTTFTAGANLEVLNQVLSNTDGSVGIGQSIKNIKIYNVDRGDAWLNNPSEDSILLIGLDYTAPDDKYHYTAPDNRLHYSTN